MSSYSYQLLPVKTSPLVNIMNELDIWSGQQNEKGPHTILNIFTCKIYPSVKTAYSTVTEKHLSDALWCLSDNWQMKKNLHLSDVWYMSLCTDALCCLWRLSNAFSCDCLQLPIVWQGAQSIWHKQWRSTNVQSLSEKAWMGCYLIFLYLFFQDLFQYVPSHLLFNRKSSKCWEIKLACNIFRSLFLLLASRESLKPRKFWNPEGIYPLLCWLIG